MGGWSWGDEPQTPAQQRASENQSRVTQFAIDQVRTALSAERPVALNVQFLCELHRIAMEGLIEEAGMLRTQDVRITGSRHLPPTWQQVRSLLDDLVDYCEAMSGKPLHVAAYVLWRLNWIHPFAPDGNGRTARIICFILLFAGLKLEPVAREGQPSLLEGLSTRKYDYIDALEEADSSWASGNLNVNALEKLLYSVAVASLQP